MKIIHICFIGTRTYALFNKDIKNISITGIDVQLYNWAKAFSGENYYKISFVVGDYGQADRENYDGIDVWKANKPKNSNIFEGIWNFLKLFRLFKRINADIYITRGPGELPFETALFCKIYRKKFINMICHDWDVNGKFNEKHRIMGFLNDISQKWAHIVITQNEEQNKILLNKGIESKRINNVFSVSDTNVYKEGKYVLWVAQSHYIKRPQVFLNLARKFPDNDFVMILQKYNIDIFNEIRDQGKSMPNLKIIPGVTFHEIDEYYKNAKIFVNTSEGEGFPNSFIQAMLNGTPILSLSVNPSRIITNEKIGFVSNDNMESFYNNFQNLISNKKIYEECAQNCLKVVKRDFDVKKNIDAFKKVIEKL